MRPDPGFQLPGIGPAGMLNLSLAGDQPFTVNLIPVWAVDDWVGTSVSFSALISGLAMFNLANIPGSATANETVTFLANGIEDLTFSFDLATSFGAITGSVHSRGVETVIPEPSTLRFVVAVALMVCATPWEANEL